MKQRKYTLAEIVKTFNLEVTCGKEFLEKEISGGYVSDLLSDVMANSQKDNIWITLQGHPNIVAVAKLKELAGIIIINRRKPDGDTLKKAREEEVPIMTSDLPAFTLVGKLYESGISGMR
jgi:predicted transcriptional regulator